MKFDIFQGFSTLEFVMKQRFTIIWNKYLDFLKFSGVSMLRRLLK